MLRVKKLLKLLLLEREKVPLYTSMFADVGLDIDNVELAGARDGTHLRVPITPQLKAADASGNTLSSGAAMKIIDTFTSLHAFALRGRGNAVSIDLQLSVVGPVRIGKRYYLSSRIIKDDETSGPLTALSATVHEGEGVGTLLMVASHSKCLIHPSKTEIGQFESKL